MRRAMLNAGTKAALAGLVAVSAAGCAGGDSGSGHGKNGTTFVYGASADPVTIDGAYASDGESLRVIRQIFETLVTTKPGRTDVEPWLAERYTPGDGGRTWTFDLKKGVTFSDGTPFDARAVCFNFDRWFHFTDPVQQTAAYYFQTVVGAFADKARQSLYKSCAAKDDHTAVIHLNRPSAAFLSALSVPSLSIASPAALRKYDADKVGGTPDQPRFEGSFGDAHPVGTGPFVLQSWTRGDKLVLVRNDHYWGPRPALSKIIIKAISDGSARRQALESGDIDAYDNVSPGDVAPLKAAGRFTVLERPAFNIGYVGFNQTLKPFDNLKIRQAVAYALNRPALVRAKYGAGAEVAKEFQPRSLFGYADDVRTYGYDPAMARRLIQESGVKDPTVQFWYPTNVSRSYLPDPAANFQAFQRDLRAVGFTVKAKAAPWDAGYVSGVQAGKAPMFLLGWVGDFGDPDDFLGSLWQGDQPQWGIKSGSRLSNLLDAAEKETDQGRRARMYQEINRESMRELPGVPYVTTEPAIALKSTVHGYVPNPVGSSDAFAPITIG